MVIEINYDRCRMCGTYVLPICVDRCPTTAIRVVGSRVEVTEFLCEDCNECGMVCPDQAITIKLVTW